MLNILYVGNIPGYEDFLKRKQKRRSDVRKITNGEQLRGSKDCIIIIGRSWASFVKDYSYLNYLKIDNLVIEDDDVIEYH